MPVCPSCQSENPEGARFCERCGRSLADRRSWRWLAVVSVGILVLTAAVAVAISLGGGGRSKPQAEAIPPTPTGTGTASSPTPTGTGPEVNLGHFPHRAYGDRLNFGIYYLDTRDDECTVNAFQYLGIGKDSGAYYSGCSDWESGGFDLYLFNVYFYNKSDEPVTLRRANFSLLDRRGERHRVVDIREEALLPEFFIARKEQVKPSKLFDGWLVFDADPDFVPKKLSYRDGDETFTIVFEGKIRRFPPR